MEAAENKGTTETTGAEAQVQISIPGDHVLTALNRLVASGELTEDGKAQVLWFYGHCKAKRMSLEDAGKLIDRHATVISKLFNGRYEAAYTNVLADIATYRKIAEDRAKRKNIGFIETTIWKKVSVVCRSALFDGMPAYIYGASQIGKTFCLEEYARRNNHGQTRYVRMCSAPTYRKVLGLIGAACYISDRNNEEDLTRRIYESIDENTLLIIDELHEVFVGSSELAQRKIIELIREIYDRTHCGIVICGTKVVQDQFERGPQRMIWDQFRRRGMIELVLPDVAPRSDIVKIAAAFGLEEPDQNTMAVIRAMMERSGTGMYCKFLQFAHRCATEQKQALTWKHFTQAYTSIRAMGQASKE